MHQTHAHNADACCGRGGCRQSALRAEPSHACCVPHLRRTSVRSGVKSYFCLTLLTTQKSLHQTASAAAGAPPTPARCGAPSPQALRSIRVQCRSRADRRGRATRDGMPPAGSDPNKTQTLIPSQNPPKPSTLTVQTVVSPQVSRFVWFALLQCRSAAAAAAPMRLATAASMAPRVRPQPLAPTEFRRKRPRAAGRAFFRVAGSSLVSVSVQFLFLFFNLLTT